MDGISEGMGVTPWGTWAQEFSLFLVIPSIKFWSLGLHFSMGWLGGIIASYSIISSLFIPTGAFAFLHRMFVYRGTSGDTHRRIGLGGINT